jgi:hypothetical protein
MCSITVNSLFGKTTSARVARSKEPWHVRFMRHRLFQRWFAVLGMVAMLGAIIVVPAASALTTAGTASAASVGMGDMPCHNPAKPCPDCPKKSCPSMGACLVKCFQALSPLPTGARLDRVTVSSRVFPVPSQVPAGSLVPPLLRPPSV